jgi:hypothetical protein
MVSCLRVRLFASPWYLPFTRCPQSDACQSSCRPSKKKERERKVKRGIKLQGPKRPHQTGKRERSTPRCGMRPEQESSRTARTLIKVPSLAIVSQSIAVPGVIPMLVCVLILMLMLMLLMVDVPKCRYRDRNNKMSSNRIVLCQNKSVQRFTCVPQRDLVPSQSCWSQSVAPLSASVAPAAAMASTSSVSIPRASTTIRRPREESGTPSRDAPKSRTCEDIG